ncbi:MAG: tryptophan synthase subunit alpha [Bacteroidetes bacterium]|nr:tryptophan synthase subunit alpha [Bacteroidota bacterium]
MNGYNNPLMTHLIIGYPSLEESFNTAELYTQYQPEFLELQIPFSHPTADGSKITEANKIAIQKNATTMDDSMNFIERFRKKYPDQKLMIMTYCNKIFRYGITEFCRQMDTMGIRYIIIPDLPVDSNIAAAIHDNKEIQLVPVIAPNIPEQRLNKILSFEPDYIYLMADYKITGSDFGIHEKLENVVGNIRKRSDARIGIGFGIGTGAQVKEILELGDFAIIGSELINAQIENRLEDKLRELIA